MIIEAIHLTVRQRDIARIPTGGTVRGDQILFMAEFPCSNGHVRGHSALVLTVETPVKQTPMPPITWLEWNAMTILTVASRHPNKAIMV